MYYFLLFILVTAICIYYFLYKNKNYSKDNSELDNSIYKQDDIEKEIKLTSEVKKIEEIKPSSTQMQTEKVEKKNFEPFHHKDKIEKADLEIKEIRDYYFNKGKNEGFIINKLKRVEGLVFEEMVLSCFKEAGFRIWRSPRHTGDGGLDGMIFKNEFKILLQSKCWEKAINSSDVAKFCELIKQRNGGYLQESPRLYTKMNLFFNMKNIFSF